MLAVHLNKATGDERPTVAIGTAETLSSNNTRVLIWVFEVGDLSDKGSG